MRLGRAPQSREEAGLPPVQTNAQENPGKKAGRSISRSIGKKIIQKIIDIIKKIRSFRSHKYQDITQLTSRRATSTYVDASGRYRERPAERTQGVQSISSAGTRTSTEFATWQTRLTTVYNEMDVKSPGWSDGKCNLTSISALGSHDSGTYTMKLNPLAPVAVTQTENLQEQLNGGVRYLDMRIRSSGEQFIIHHGLVDGTDCVPEFDHVFRFARENPHELITIKVQLDREGSNTEKLDKFYKKVIKPHERLLIKRDKKTQNISDIKVGDIKRKGNILLLVKHKEEDTNPYLIRKYPACWGYKENAGTKWVNTPKTDVLLQKNEALLCQNAANTDRKNLFISQYQKTSLTQISRDAIKPLREQAASNEKVADSVLSAVKANPQTKPNILNTDFVNEYGGERNKYQLLAFNLLGVDEDIIRKNFPACADKILRELYLIEQARKGRSR